MYSGFITPYGVLEYNDHVWEKVKNSEFGQEMIKEKGSEYRGKIAGSLFLTGEQNAGFYNGEWFIQDCHRAIDIAEANWPNKLFVLYLDHARLHKLLALDALDVSNLNLGIGGSKPKLRDGWYYVLKVDGSKQKITQSMVFQEDHPKYPGQPKGARVICFERFGCFSIYKKSLQKVPLLKFQSHRYLSLEI